jgi:hypothetical protein
VRQVLAVAVAALLVAAAVVARNALDDDGDGVLDDDTPVDELTISCVPELEDACEAVGARVEDPADTLAGDAVDAWITFDPWPAVAAEGDDPVRFGGERVPVAASALLLLTRDEACADWDCAVDVDAALPPPATALGLLLAGHAALSWNDVARPGESFASNDFELPEFQAWLQALDFTRDPVDDMLVLGPAGPDATGTTRATFEDLVRPSPRGDGITASATNVAATVAVVVVGPAAERVAGDERLLDGLTALGWDLDPAAATTGLPNPGVLFALLQEIA